jgi:ATP-dependent RNA helicase DDX23/PRP28
VILDEADKMIDYEMEESVNFILEAIPQNLNKTGEKEHEVAFQEGQMARGERFYKTFVMFSATMLPYIEKIARKYLKFPAMV